MQRPGRYGSAGLSFLGGRGLPLLLRNARGIPDAALLLFPLGRLARLLGLGACVQIVLLDRILRNRKAAVGDQRFGVLQAAVAVDEEVCGSPTTVPLLRRAVDALEQSQLVLILGEPA